MDELDNHTFEIGLPRRFAVSVLITAPPDQALAIASAIADGRATGPARLVIFDGAAILDPLNWERRELAGADSDEELVVRDVGGLNDEQQAALMRLLETGMRYRRRRIIATSPTCLFERVKDGSFLDQLFYRLNVIHIVSDS